MGGIEPWSFQGATIRLSERRTVCSAKGESKLDRANNELGRATPAHGFPSYLDLLL